MDQLFTEAGLERIRVAVGKAEGQTSGEIVPFIMPESDNYSVAVWRGGVMAALVGLALALLIFQFYTGWGLGWLYTGWGTALVALGAGIVGALLAAYVKPVKRLLAGEAQLTRTVHHRAMRAFVEEEVFDTRDRTGILIFVSLFEHRIEVLGDAGINKKVSSDDWVEVVERIQRGIRSGELAEGLVEAIGLCGELLHRKGVGIRPDDENELSDSVRIRRDD
jgi:putative membrane protein